MFNHRGRAQISINSSKSVTKYLCSLISTQSNPDRQFVNFLELYKCRYVKTIHTNISESNTEDISYVVLLEDWDILPNKLNVLDRTLGAGKFGIVKHGLYTPYENDDPLDVAVKMLKGTILKL